MMEDKKSIKYVLAEKRFLVPLSAMMFIGLFLLANFLLNIVLAFFASTSGSLFNSQPLDIGFNDFFRMPIGENLMYYLVVLLLASVIVGKFAYDLRSSFKDLNDNQKGSSCFTTLEELKAQYKAVPEKDERYSGGGGVVISRYVEHKRVLNEPWQRLREEALEKKWAVVVEEMKKVKEAKGMEKWRRIQVLKKISVPKIFIDDSPVNNLIIGTTRSGKGETFVFPTIDVYSRATNQPSLILNDPKGGAPRSAVKSCGYVA